MDAQSNRISAPAGAFPRTGPETAAAMACVLAAALLCIFVRRSANDDMISYIALAQHWLDLRPDLAVSGTWSPLFPWLLIPALALIPDPILAAHVVHAGTAVLFFLGGLAFLRRVVPADMVGAGAVALAAYGAVRSATLVTPDLLSAALFALYCRAVLDVADEGRPRQALGAGALLGLCYLAKAAVLMTGVAGGALLLGHCVLAGRLAPARAARLLAVLLAGTLLVGGPWMAALTVKYGRPTLSTAGATAFAEIGPPDQDRSHPHTRFYVVPETGRRSQFEDESILPQAAWSPLHSRAYAVWYARRVVDNLARIVAHLGRFDAFHLGLSSAAWGLALLAWRWKRRAAPWQDAALLALPAALAYAPIFADQQRYYYLAFPLLLAAALGFGADVLASRLPRRAVSLVVAASFLLALGASVPELGLARQEQVSVDFGRAVAPDLLAAGLAGPVANAGYEGWTAEYLSYFLGTAYYGGRKTPTPEQAASSCARLLVARRGFGPDRMLAASPLFRDLDGAVPAIAGTRWQVFENLNWRSDCPPGPR